MNVRFMRYTNCIEVFISDDRLFDGDEELGSGLLTKDEAKEYRDAFRRADEELSEFIGDEG